MNRVEKLSTFNNEKILSNDSPVITNHPEDKFETLLFLPPGEGRKGEGGLRTKGYFKHSYKLNLGDNLWYICDTAGNLVKPAPEGIQNKIVDYINSIQSSETEREKTETFNELPLITVITVVFNGEKYLEQAIQSVINQTYPNVEFIIIDGGSTDGTLDIIKKYEEHIDYWVSERDNGIYDAMNKGVRVSLGSWMGFLGSDDFYEKDSLENLIRAYLADRSIDIIYGESRVLFENDLLYIRRPSKNVHDMKKNFLFIHPDSIAKTNVYKKIGMYNASFKLVGDYEFFLRAYFQNFKFRKVDKIVLNFNVGGFSYRYKLMFIERLRLFKNYKLNLFFLILCLFDYLKGIIKNSFMSRKRILKMLYKITKNSHLL